MLRTTAAALLVFVATSIAFAQREPRLPFPAEKFSPRPVQQEQSSEPPAQLSEAANPQRWAVVQTPWAKFCGMDKNEPQAKPVCITAREIRLQNRANPFLAGVALIEADGEAKTILRATLPPDLRRSAPVVARIDKDSSRNGTHRECRPNGCMWDFPADAAFVARLKAGEWLHLEGVSASGKIASYRLPLSGFARANEGAPTDPAAFEKAQQRRWEERSRKPSGEPK
jgi:invasion protein IalB